MSYTAPTLSTLITRVKGDIQSALTFAPDGSLRPVPYLLMVLCRDGIGTAFAGVSWGLHKGIEYLFQEATPLTATRDGLLDAHGSLVGVFPKAATPARLTVRFFGAAGAVVPLGLYATRSDGARFDLTAGHTYATTSYWDVTVQAATAGTSGNTAPGVLLTLSNTPAGVNAAGEVIAQIQAGADADTTDTFRPGVVAAYQGAGSAGGTAEDWVAWCKEVAGVWGVTATSPSTGLVNLVIKGPPDGTHATGTAPDETTLQSVRDYLDAYHAPVDARWTVTGWAP